MRRKQLTPKQKRLLRDKVKQEKQEAKKVRLLSHPKFSKTARSEYSSERKKTARYQKNPGSIMQLFMTWCEKDADLEGQWSWGQDRQWSDEEWKHNIEPYLLQMEKLTWAEIYAQRTGGKNRHKKHHDMDIGVICDEAFERWIEIKLEEYDTAFRFRFGGKQRLWGYKILEKFKIVWWDPLHKIYPVEIS